MVTVLAGGIVWVVLFIAFLVLARRSPRRRVATGEATGGHPEALVLGVGGAAFLVGVAVLLLLLQDLLP